MIKSSRIELNNKVHNSNIVSFMLKGKTLFTIFLPFCRRYHTPETLESGAFSGAILETYAVSEILKSYWHNGESPAIYFYRDKDRREVDIILEESGKLYPLEIKQKSNPNTNDIKNFAVFSRFKKEIAPGGVLCLAPTHLPLGKKDFTIPISYI